jgi:hypothetical protein
LLVSKIFSNFKRERIKKKLRLKSSKKYLNNQIIMTQITLSVARLNELMEGAAVCAAHKALIFAGVPIREYYTRADLQRKFGRGKINRMISAGALIPHKLEEDGKKVYAIADVLKQII